MNSYDVAIIGAGIGGLMTAYRLNRKNPRLSIIILDKGEQIEQRYCVAADKGVPCCHCKVCAITSGYSGAGAFSDAKYNIGTSYGGTLAEEIGQDEAMKYINCLDNLLKAYTLDYPSMYCSDDSLKLKCLQNNLQLLDMNVRHLGTDRNQKTMKLIIDSLKSVEMLARTCVEDINYNVKESTYELKYIIKDLHTTISAKNVIIATGRSGATFVKQICEKFNIKVSANTVDLGVRVEMPDVVWKEFSDKIYEPKILYKTKTFEDRTRMFCFNQGGIVSAENNQGIITANGHSYADVAKKTDNCNFSILSSIHFTEPFNKPTEYVQNIAKLANAIGDGNVLIQRFGDLISGRRTNNHRLAQNSVKPTLKATAGDLSLVLPYRVLTNIIETIYALNKVAPGTANDDTLIYGVEAKYYSLKPEHNGNFEIADSLYLIGDGSGITRGLSQAGAMGLYVADKILEKM